MNLRNTGTSLGLAIGLSLAVGYLAGRLHAEIPLDEHSDAEIPSTAVVSNLHSPPTEHVELIPDPVRPELIGKDANRAEEKYAPRHIGAFIDPEEVGPEPASEPRHIGHNVDPDQPWVEAQSTERVELGEFLEPDDYDQGP